MTSYTISISATRNFFYFLFTSSSPVYILGVVVVVDVSIERWKPLLTDLSKLPKYLKPSYFLFSGSVTWSSEADRSTPRERDENLWRNDVGA